MLRQILEQMCEYHGEGQQQLVDPLEDVGLCAEAGGVSAAVSSQVCFKDMAESSHQHLEVTHCHP